MRYVQDILFLVPTLMTYCTGQSARRFRSRVCRLRSNFFQTDVLFTPFPLPSTLRLHLAASELLKVHSGIPESGISLRKEDDCNHVGS